MQRFYLENRYGSGNSPTQNYDYDYFLFRQDWGGQESIYFNKDELTRILGEIEEGQIMIHMNYSILYCKTEELYNDVKEVFQCYCTLMPTKP